MKTKGIHDVDMRRVWLRVLNVETLSDDFDSEKYLRDYNDSANCLMKVPGINNE